MGLLGRFAQQPRALVLNGPVWQPRQGQSPSRTRSVAVLTAVVGRAQFGTMRGLQTPRLTNHSSVTWVTVMSLNKGPAPAAKRPNNPWRSPGFRRLFGATTSANLADGITLAAGPLLAAQLTGDPLLVAGVVVAQRAPWALLTLFSGVVVDRVDRRMALAAADASRGVAELGLVATLLFTSGAGVGLLALYLGFFVLGSAETLADNASLALLPETVPRAALDAAKRAHLLGDEREQRTGRTADRRCALRAGAGGLVRGGRPGLRCGILAGFVAERIVVRIGPGTVILAGNMVAATAYALLALTSSVALAAIALALASFASMCGNVVAASLRQTSVPSELLGRVTSAYRMIGLGAIPLGALTGGLAAGVFDLRTPFWLAAAGLLLVGLVLSRSLTSSAIRGAELPENCTGTSA